MINVLIADDVAGIRQQWQKIVKERGGNVVHCAKSVEEVEGSREIDYDRIDTAIVDYKYEGEDKTGIDLITHLKSKGVTRVYLCTGFYDDPAIRDAAHQAGADSIIPKPINESNLSDLLS